MPYSLNNHRGIKRELISLYRQAKAGQIAPQLLGRLVHLLSILAGIERDVELEARLRALEEAAELEPEPERWPASTGASHARH